MWVWTAFEPKHKIILADEVGQRTQQVGEKLFEKIETIVDFKRDILISTDGLSSYETIIKKRYAKEVKSYRHLRTGEKVPDKVILKDNIHYVQVIKEVDEYGHIKRIRREIVFGDPKKIKEILNSQKKGIWINVSYIERAHHNFWLLRAHFGQAL